ncbi:MAG: ABC transporter permease, partial [Alistipes sp.]|nr:ABC transporter permease [Alistipes sp.]
WTSIPILMLSGASFPQQAIPEWLYTFGKIFPSSSGVSAFIRIQSMGASFEEGLPEIRVLWSLAIVYAGLSCIGIHLITKREFRREHGDAEE